MCLEPRKKYLSLNSSLRLTAQRNTSKKPKRNTSKEINDKQMHYEEYQLLKQGHWKYTFKITLEYNLKQGDMSIITTSK